MSRPISAAIQNAQGLRKTGVDEIDITNNLNGDYLGRATAERKRKLDTLDTGTPLPGQDELELFRTQYTDPEMDDYLPQLEEVTNVVQTVNVLSKPIYDDIPTPQPRELCILFMDNEYNKNTVYLESRGMWAQANPQVLVNPPVLNYILYEIQRKMFKRDKEAYYSLSAEKLMKDFVIFGIAEFINEPQYGAECGERLLTMSVRGPQFIFNYFPPNIMAGGRIFAMFRKEIVPDRYYLTIPERENTTTPVQRKTETHQTFMPWQMTFLSLPRGGPVPREKLRFYDEQGILRSDPMIVQLGQVFANPQDHIYREVHDSTMPEIFNVSRDNTRAFNDIRKGAGYTDGTIQHMQLIFNCNGGLGF